MNGASKLLKIAIASGKGGTGKTTVAIAMAQSCPGSCTLLDCDVEEPNCHLFLTETPDETQEAKQKVPEFQPGNCIGCGTCAIACRFHALAQLGHRILVFDELCHSCGGCVSACPTGALREKQHRIGEIQFRRSGSIRLVSGVLDVGNAMSPPLIRQLKNLPSADGTILLDAPPGTACPMVTTVRGCDFVLLVTEPTPFGLYDLRLALETLQSLHLPYGVIVNRAEPEATLIRNFSRESGVPLLLEIPFSRRVAQAYAEGRNLLDVLPGLRHEFAKLQTETIPQLLQKGERS